MIKLYNGDCLNTMKQLDGNSIDTIITDPPYGLKFMNKKWDYKIPSVEHFKEMLRVAKPGATLLCFGGTRTWHRIAVNIEDAGWEIVDTLMWLYGTGFPKALDISKSIDKKLGKEREVIGTKQHAKKDFKDNLYAQDPANKNNNKIFGYGEEKLTVPASNEAKTWNGWKSHALKPAYEPIIMARKRNDETYVNNALKYGVAGLNIDGSRIGINDEYFKMLESKSSKNPTSNYNNKDYQKYGDYKKNIATKPNNKGRYPANVLLDEEAGRLLDKQSGVSKSCSTKRNRKVLGSFGMPNDDTPEYSDKGGASRFFYCAKASKSERNKGCETLHVLKDNVPLKIKKEIIKYLNTV